ncbi:uncharacterized protein LOC117335727 [Pecten maximus]|uniref:uncharacterized protein LOC117335727 n=1 Tax=Pecten maximus TaxID=6579 RepID=UPI00145898C2|nr:uncharacterized protein LOC117335727 [Pecten maximus]
MVAFQGMVLKDKDDKTTVAIWEDLVNTIEKGHILQLTKCKVRLFNDEKRLTTTRGSLCEKYSHDGTLQNISSEDDDDDENLSSSGDKLQNGSLCAVYDVDPYLSCPYPGCNNKKLSTVKCDDQYKMFCCSCKVTYTASSCNHYLRVTMLFESVQGASSFPTETKVTLFKPELDKILIANGITTEPNYENKVLIETIVNILLKEIRCTIMNNTVKNIVCKRVISE